MDTTYTQNATTIGVVDANKKIGMTVGVVVKNTNLVSPNAPFVYSATTKINALLK
jgi:hypothetical protein